LETPKHVKSVRGETSCTKATNIFVTLGSKSDVSVSAAEGTLAFHVAKHHHSYKSMDCGCRLLKTILPDSDIARKMSCARTNSEVIVNSVLAPHSVQTFVKTMSKFFTSCKMKIEDCFSELLIIDEFFFAIPSHNANTKRVFSLMQSQWTKERNKLHVESGTELPFAQHNFKHMSRQKFHAYLGSQPNLFKASSSSGKYAWAQPQSTVITSISSNPNDSDDNDSEWGTVTTVF
jgi:hypothetical protein